MKFTDLHGIWKMHLEGGEVIILSGILDIDNSKLICTTTLKMKDLPFGDEDNLHKKFYVTGNMVNGLPCTLYTCYKSQVRPVDHEILTFEIIFQKCLLGEELLHEDEQTFIKSEIVFSGLDNFQIKKGEYQEGIEDIGISLSIKPYGNQNYLRYQNNSTTERTIFIEFDEPQKLEEMNTLVYKLRCFFMMALSAHINIEKFSVIANHGFGGEYKAGNVRLTVFQETHSEKKQRYNFSNVKYFGDKPLSKWFTLFDQYEFQIKTIFDYLAYELSLETGFMACVHAIEGFHRIKENTSTLSGNYMEEELYAKSVASKLYELISSFSLCSAHNQSLKNRIKYGFQKSLRSRIKELLEYVESHISIFFKVLQPKSEKQSSGYYVNTIIELRNYYAHLDPASDERTKRIANDYIEIYNYRTSAFWFLYSLMLLEMVTQKHYAVETLKNANMRYTYDFFETRIAYKDKEVEYARKQVSALLDELKKNFGEE